MDGTYPSACSRKWKLFDDLRAYYGKALDENADYAKVMAVGARLIAIAKQLKPHPDGPLGVFRIGREIFAFLQSEFGLVPGQTTRTKLDYSSDGVCVKIHYPTQYDSACRIIDLANPTLHENPFSLEDLLFMDGRSVSLKLPPRAGHQDRGRRAGLVSPPWQTCCAGMARECSPASPRRSPASPRPPRSVSGSTSRNANASMGPAYRKHLTRFKRRLPF